MKILRRYIRRRRAANATAQLADALIVMKGAISAGLTIRQAIEMAAGEIEAPLGEDLARAANCMKLGGSVEDALALFCESVPTDDVWLFARSVEILRKSGGSMGECFDNLIATMERRREVEGKIRSLTAQGVMQAATLLTLPWFMMLALHIVAPDFISPLFDTKLGNLIISFAALLELAGALWLRKIVVIRV